MLGATTPWRLMVEMLCGVGRAFDWLPFVRLAWTLRGVVGVICVVQSVAEGRAAPGGLGGVVIALTYLVPAAGRRIEHLIEAEADRFVLDLGLGAVLAGLLRRSGRPMTFERTQRLEAAPPPPLPRLRLVHGWGLFSPRAGPTRRQRVGYGVVPEAATWTRARIHRPSPSCGW